MKYVCLLPAFLLAAASTADAQEVTLSVSQRFERRDTQAVPDFQKHVVPLLGRLGCNSATCHGSFQGQGGFQLSLFGFDFRLETLTWPTASSLPVNLKSGSSLKPGVYATRVRERASLSICV